MGYFFFALKILFIMGNDIEEKLRQIRIEDYIWVIYIGIIALSYYSNYLEKKYYVSSDLYSKDKYRNIIILIFSILLIVYFYFLYDSYKSVKDLKSILDDLKLKSFLKTSGGKGYHILVPLDIKVTWKKLSKIASDIAKLMEESWPEKYTSNIRLKNRKGKIFIDWLRNTEGASCIAPYSLRARNGAKVSMPIKWSELDKVRPDDIDIKEALKRLKRKDPWEDFF